VKKLKKVLIVDTDQKFIKSIKDFFTKYKAEIVIAKDGNQVLEILDNSFDLIIAEIVIPKIDGLKLSKTIYTKFGSALPVLIVSGIYKGSSIKNKALSVNKASAFLEKPFSLESLKKTILEKLNLELEEEKEDDEGKTQLFEKEEMEKMVGKEISPEERELMSSDDLFGDILKEINEKVEKDINKEKEKVEKEIEKTQNFNHEEVKQEIEEIEEIEEINEIEEAKEEIPEIQEIEPEKETVHHDKHSHKKSDTLDIDKLITDIITPKDKKKEVIKKEEKKTKRNIETDDIDKLIRKTLVELKKTGYKKPARTSEKREEQEKLKKELEEKKEEIQKNVDKIEGRYELLSKIATGGMAEIYKAKQKGPVGFEKIVTIKKILPHLAQDDDFITMFIDEARIAASLSHPNIVQIFDLGKMNNEYIIAMEYVSGKDLGAVLKKLRKQKKSLPMDIALYIALKISDALDYAHRKKDSKGEPLNIVHRDVNPNNILLSYEGEVKLTDFGISKAKIKLHQTVAGGLKGKLIYMSPEQAMGKEDIDSRSDIFAIGVLLYEMLTLRNPFIATSETAILEKVRKVEYDPPNIWNKSISENILKIIKKCLMKSPDDRYQTAKELSNEIEKELVKEVNNVAIMKDILSKFMARMFPEEVRKEGFSIEDTTEIIKKKKEFDEIIRKKEEKKVEEVIETPEEEKKEIRRVEKTEKILEEKKKEKIKEIIEPSTEKEKPVKEVKEDKSKEKVKELNEEIESVLMEEKKSSKALLIIIILMVILGGAGYYFYSNYVAIKEFPINPAPVKKEKTIASQNLPVESNLTNEQTTESQDLQTNIDTTQNTQNTQFTNQNTQTQQTTQQKIDTTSQNQQKTQSNINQAQNKIKAQNQKTKTITTPPKTTKKPKKTNQNKNIVSQQKQTNQKNQNKSIQNTLSQVQSAKSNQQPQNTANNQQTNTSANNNTQNNQNVNSQQTNTTNQTQQSNQVKPQKTPLSKPEVQKPAFKEGEVVPLNTLDKPLKILKRGIPSLTYEEARLGNVRLFIQMLVGPDGKVEKFRVIRSIPPVAGMEQKMAKVIDQWRFTKPRRNGIKVRTWKMVSLLIKK